MSKDDKHKKEYLAIIGLLFLFITIFSFQSYSQQIENVDFNVEDNVLIVSYDLVKCPPKELYDIRIRILNDKNTILEPLTIKGDLKHVVPGKGKKIEWNVLNDKTELKGKIQVQVEITKTLSTKITDGPANAFASMLLPGLGDRLVNKNSRGWYYVSGLYLGMAYYSLQFKISSSLYYNRYHAATTQTEMDADYKAANDANQAFQIGLGVTAAIWLADVVYVTVRGFQNKRTHLKSYTQNNQNLKMFFVGLPGSMQIGFVKKF